MAVPTHPQQAHLVPGYRLDDRYELLYPFAQGGMATVWVARIQGKHGFEKLVAVKTILSHLAREEGFRAMFLDEASIAARIRHPNVVSTLDVEAKEGELFLIMEYVHGEPLSRLIRNAVRGGSKIPPPIVATIMAGALHGLHAAHELVHALGEILDRIVWSGRVSARAHLTDPLTPTDLADAFHVSLRTLQRSPRLAGGPMWPGGLALHRNGSLIAVYGRWAHRLDRRSLRVTHDEPASFEHHEDRSRLALDAPLDAPLGAPLLVERELGTEFLEVHDRLQCFVRRVVEPG